MAHMWGEADWPRLHTAILLEDRITRRIRDNDLKGLSGLVAQHRLILDDLGLTEKGRRDNRWQLPDESEEPGLATVTEFPRNRNRRDPRFY